MLYLFFLMVLQRVDFVLYMLFWRCCSKWYLCCIVVFCVAAIGGVCVVLVVFAGAEVDGICVKLFAAVGGGRVS